MQDLRQQTLEKVEYLKDQGFNVVEMWTCDIERKLAADPEMKTFFDKFEIAESLKPRELYLVGVPIARVYFITLKPMKRCATWFVLALPLL